MLADALQETLRHQPFDPMPARELLARYDNSNYPLTCTFGKALLEVDEGVFSPVLTSASPFLLEAVDFKPDERMLDAFAGSGAFAVNAALNGASAVTFDVSEAATKCAAKNAAKNGVSELIDIRQGTLHECISPDEKFDLITANPPLIAGNPQDSLEAALFDPGLQATKELVTALPELLARRGRCYLLTSDIIDRKGYEYDIASHCRERDLRVSIVAQLYRPYETYRVHKIQHRRSVAGVLQKFAIGSRP